MALKRPAVFSELEQYAAAHPQPWEYHEGQHTTHYSVVDSDGNAVAVTTTINDWFGSHVTADGLGFLLNDEMDDFSSKPGVPNSDKLIQGAANAIGPGKRPLSSMTPTIVARDGKLFLVLGSPGSSKIITTVANVLMGVVDYGMNIQEAVDAPRFHNQWLPDTLYVERYFSPDTVQSLKKWAITCSLVCGKIRTPAVTGATLSASLSTRKLASGLAPRIIGAMGVRWDTREWSIS